MEKNAQSFMCSIDWWKKNTDIPKCGRVVVLITKGCSERSEGLLALFEKARRIPGGYGT